MSNARVASEKKEKQTAICAIGASAGGVKALEAFFEKVDTQLGLAYVVIIHLSPEYDSQLSQILAGRTDITQID